MRSTRPRCGAPLSRAGVGVGSLGSGDTARVPQDQLAIAFAMRGQQPPTAVTMRNIPGGVDERRLRLGREKTYAIDLAMRGVGAPLCFRPRRLIGTNSASAASPSITPCAASVCTVGNITSTWIVGT